MKTGSLAAAAILMASAGCGPTESATSAAMEEPDPRPAVQERAAEQPASAPARHDSPKEAPAATQTSACTSQGGRSIGEDRLRAVGTEPFWSATVEGRCVTYSHPDNQAGTRVWTIRTGTARYGTWSGTYEGKAFVVRTRPQADCSDGMSDRVYPIAVTLTVNDETRHGCAELL